MQGRIWIILLAALLLAGGRAVGQWHALELEGGGVAHDLQLVYHDNPNDARDQVWAACMNTGSYRATWSNGAWSAWTEHLAGRGILGIDAVEVSGTEYVLAAGGNNGVWYKNGTNAWDRPPNLEFYPAAWKWVRVHDAAFYWPTPSGSPGESQYFMLLHEKISEQVKPGIYRWDNVNRVFARADGLGDNSYFFSHFYRDINNPNILYVTSPDGIYKLYGSYTVPKFEKLPAETKLEDLPIARPPAGLPPLPARP